MDVRRDKVSVLKYDVLVSGVNVNICNGGDELERRRARSVHETGS